MTSTKTIITVIIVIHVLLVTVGCKLMAATFYPIMAALHGADNVQIAGCSLDGKDYGHAYLFVNNKPFEPRFLGLYLMSHINYTDPIVIWNTVEEFKNDESLIPFN